MQDISDCLSPQAQNVAEARLAAKRAARAEAREIRMKELERQQKEVEERPDKDFGDKSSRPVSSLSAATLASLGGTSSRRGSGDTSISVDTEASIREIKDSLTEVEEKYKRSMVTNAQLDNEKTSLQYQVDMMQDVLLELEEELAEARRQYDEKHKECERQKHDQTVLRFQLAEMKEALEQRESLLTKHGIALDSEDTPNGDTSLESHVNSDSRPDPPIRVTSMGKLEETFEKKENLSAVGESPPFRNEQDTQEVLQDTSPKTPPPVETRNTMKEQSPKENDSNTDCKVEPSLSDTFSDSVTELEHLKAEQPHDSESVKDEKEIVADSCLPENLNRGETEQIFAEDLEVTLNQNDVSPAEEIFQDALDDVQSPSSISPLSNEPAFSLDDCKTKDHYENQQEDAISKVKSESSEGKVNTENALEIPEYKDQKASDIPANVSDIHAGEEDEHKTSSPDSSSKYESGASSTDETTDEEHDQVCEEKLNPEEASVDIEPKLQDTEDNPGKTNSIVSNITDEKSSDAVNECDIHDDDDDKISTIPEKSSQDIQDTKEEKPPVELDASTSSKASESSLLGPSESTFDDKAGKDYINLGDGHQEQNEDTTDGGSLHIVPKEKECEKAENFPPNTADTVLLDQGKENKVSDSLMHAEGQNPNNKAAIDSDTLKTSQNESFSSADESAPEGEESDDEDDNQDGAVRSEKYTGESLPLGSSVDRSSMDDIRMEDSSDKALKKGKGKNKEDCVVS